MCGPLGRGTHMSFILSRRARCALTSPCKSSASSSDRKSPAVTARLFLCVLCVRRERKSHKEGKFLWMMLYYPAKLAES